MAAGDSAKADQIAFHIYTKLFHVLYAARASEQGPGTGKTDKWFNLETPLAPSAATPTTELDAYRTLSSTTPPQHPLALQVLLVVPPPGGGTALVHKPTGTRLEPEPRHVLLEEWVLDFLSPSSSTSASTSTSETASLSSASSSTDEETDVLPPTIYKNAIPLFRALYALLRILPAWRVVRKLTGRRPGAGASAGGAGGGGGKRGLKVVVRLRPEGEIGMGGTRMGGNGGGNGNNGGEATLAFGASPAPDAGGTAPADEHAHVPGDRASKGRLTGTFLLVTGTLTLSATYLTTPTFSLESLEALLSSRFAVLDARGPSLRPSPPRFSNSRQPTSGSPVISPANRLSRLHQRRKYESKWNWEEARAAGGVRQLRTERREEDEDEEEFVPTLQRRSITTSTTSTGTTTGSPGRYTSALPPISGGGGGGMSSSPGRYTSPLPPTGTSSSPGRYSSALRPRVDSLRTTSEAAAYPAAHPAHAAYRTISESHASTSSAAYRDAPHLWAVRIPELGVVVSDGRAHRAGAQEGVQRGPGGGRRGPVRASAERGELVVEYHRAGDEGEPGGSYVPACHARSVGEREREREREKGVPIGSGGGGSSNVSTPGLGGGAAGSLGASASTSVSSGGISGSRPVAINPFKSNTLNRSSLSGSLLRTVGAGWRGCGEPWESRWERDDEPNGGGVSAARAAEYCTEPGTTADAGAGGERECAGSSVGSGGSGESGSVSGSVGVGAPPTRERTPSAAASQGGSRSGSFLKSPVDPDTDAQHDDISTFVKDIDAARPLLGRYRQQQQQGDSNPDNDPDSAPGDADDSNGGDGASSSSSPGTSRGGTVRGAGSTVAALRPTSTLVPVVPAPQQAMLTSADEVDARLRSMNEEFRRSLVGLGGGAGRASALRGSPISPVSGSGSGLGGGSGSGSGSASGSGGQGSEEVIGRLEFG
ncbi:Autophagy-related protein 13 [Mycena venus]|uniref:Autophagy-related protein 13 n=1 Tax=Mycena venus TaxID=2733690 RepID=A0A8H7DDZ9_9AGAR|nr:Autophagy-related protein 13 [Mycena venus]